MEQCLNQLLEATARWSWDSIIGLQQMHNITLSLVDACWQSSWNAGDVEQCLNLLLAATARWSWDSIVGLWLQQHNTE